VSFFLIAAMCAVAAAAAGVAVERSRGERDDDDDGGPASGGAPPPSPFAGRGLVIDLGDVVSSKGAERWLAGALELRDGEHLLAALFFAPEGSRQEAVCAFPAPRRELLWLSPAPIDATGEPPTAIELGGVVMQRRARLPVSVRRHGQGAPDVGDTATLAEYASTSRAAGLVLATRGLTLGWAGRRLEPDEYDRMGRGEA
jgi:hypothetical protein